MSVHLAEQSELVIQADQTEHKLFITVATPISCVKTKHLRKVK